MFGLLPDGQLGTWAQWVTVTHVRRWHQHHHTAGTGPIYQGRFKSFPVQENDHYFTLCRYVERNPLRANLVGRAGQWRRSSLWHRIKATQAPWFSAGPLPEPDDWLAYVEGVETAAELEALRRSVQRGAPYGEEAWQSQTAAALGLEASLRRIGRPKKAEDTTKI